MLKTVKEFCTVKNSSTKFRKIYKSLLFLHEIIFKIIAHLMVV